MCKKISVVIPCYNVEDYIDQCIQSLVAQTIGLDVLEIILVNDASTDNTYQKLLEYEQQYTDSIIVVNQSENGKQGAARNAGMEYASGEYLGFCDADDWMEPQMYEKLYSAIRATDADYVVCARYEEFADGSQNICGPEEDGVIELDQEDFKNAICGMLASGGVCQTLYNMDFLRNVNIWFPEQLKYEDNFWTGIITYYAKRVGTISTPLYHYRIHQDSTAQSRNALHHLDRLKIELLKLEELQSRGLFQRYYEDIEREFIRLYFVNTISLFITKFDELPQGILLEMQRTVKMLFPDWKNNIMLKNFENKEMQIVPRLIDYPFQVGNKQELLQALHICHVEWQSSHDDN